MKEYTVTINWNGFVACEEEYTVYADSIEEAEQLALEEASCDLRVEETVCNEEEEEEEE